jgi:hypothetical protein
MILEILAAVAIISGPVALYLHNRNVKAAINAAVADIRGHVSSEQQKFSSAIYTKVKTDLEDLKKTHIVAIAEHAEAEVKKQLNAADVAVCDFCQRQVVKFEQLEDKIKCENCKAEGK